jgi:hypothetical protein
MKNLVRSQVNIYRNCNLFSIYLIWRTFLNCKWQRIYKQRKVSCVPYTISWAHVIKLQVTQLTILWFNRLPEFLFHKHISWHNRSIYNFQVNFSFVLRSTKFICRVNTCNIICLWYCVSLITERVDSLSKYLITRASCGASHTLAVNEWGQVFSWGSDSHGQLGELRLLVARFRHARTQSCVKIEWPHKKFRKIIFIGRKCNWKC